MSMKLGAPLEDGEVDSKSSRRFKTARAQSLVAEREKRRREERAEETRTINAQTSTGAFIIGGCQPTASGELTSAASGRARRRGSIRRCGTSGNFLDLSVRIVSVNVSYNRNRPWSFETRSDNLSCTKCTVYQPSPSRYRNREVRPELAYFVMPVSVVPKSTITSVCDRLFWWLKS